MRVRFTDNLGSRDAERFGVEFRKCLHGAEVEVPEDVAKRLIDGRFAVGVESAPAPRPQKIKGVPTADVRAEAQK